MDQKPDVNTVDALMKEAFRLHGQCKDQEAIATYEKVIDLDPNYIPAYRMKAFILLRQKGLDEDKEAIECCKQAEKKNPNSAAAYACAGIRLYAEQKFDEVFQAFDKAISIDQDDVLNYVLKGLLLSGRTKFEEAISTLDLAIEKDPNHILAYLFKGVALLNSMRSNKHEETLKCFEKATLIDPNFIYINNLKATALSHLKRNEEALKYVDLCLQSNPKHTPSLATKALCLLRLGRLDQSLEIYKECCEFHPSSVALLVSYAVCLRRTEKLEEALVQLNKSLSLEPNCTLALANRGQLLNQLGKTNEAIKDFIRVRELLQNGKGSGNLSINNIAYIKNVLAQLEDLEKTAKETSAQIEEAAKNDSRASPVVKKFIENLKNLDQKKEKITTNVIQTFSENDQEKITAAEKEVQVLKKQYIDLKLQFEKEIKEIKANAQKMEEKIEQIQKDIASIKDELDTKMVNFKKKLDKELEGHTPEDSAKLKDYFNAFLNTFSSLYVTAQVIDSGQISLDASSHKATALSAMASLAPFVGSFLSDGIKSIGEFLVSREMKVNARKMKTLASDSTELSELVGSAAYKITTNPKKQQQILQVTVQEMKNKAAGILAKILEFCKHVGEEVDAVLYGKLYKTPSALLGHQDANAIIERWLNVSIDVIETEEAFVRIALGEEEIPAPKEKANSEQTAVSSGRSSCCSLF